MSFSQRRDDIKEEISDRIAKAEGAVTEALGSARERGAQVVDAVRDRARDARHAAAGAGESLAAELEQTAAALRRHSGHSNPVTRMARERPGSTVTAAFIAGALVGVLAGMLVNNMRDER